MDSLDKLAADDGITLDPWQRAFILDERPKIILKFGRKSGKTKAMALKIVHDSAHPNWKILILSRGQRQASEVFETVKALFLLHSPAPAKKQHYMSKHAGRPTKADQARLALFKELPGIETAETRIAYMTRTKIILENGYTVYCLPSGHTGVTLRTYSFQKIYYDEGGYINDEVYNATTPCLAVAGIQLIIGGTPNGTKGFFFDEWRNPAFARYSGTTEQSGRVKPEWLASEKARMTKAEYLQEYEGVFTDIADGLIPHELIELCSQDLSKYDWQGAGALFLGVDFARFGADDNVIAWCHYADGIARIKVEVHDAQRRLTAMTGRIMSIHNSHPNLKRVITDEGGLGTGPTDDLVEMLGKKKVIGIQNQKRDVVAREAGRPSTYTKYDLYSNLLRLMERGRVILDADVQIIRSLEQARYTYTKDGNLTIRGDDSHVAEAIVRAVFPLMGKKTVFPWVSHIPHNEESILEEEDITLTSEGWEDL